MSHLLTIEVSDEVYESVVESAQAVGLPPEGLLGERVALWYPLRKAASGAEDDAAWAEFLSLAGAADLGYATGTDNEQIDADLAREYASTHDD